MIKICILLLISLCVLGIQVGDQDLPELLHSTPVQIDILEEGQKLMAINLQSATVEDIEIMITPKDFRDSFGNLKILFFKEINGEILESCEGISIHRVLKCGVNINQKKMNPISVVGFKCFTPNCSFNATLYLLKEKMLNESNPISTHQQGENPIEFVIPIPPKSDFSRIIFQTEFKQKNPLESDSRFHPKLATEKEIGVFLRYVNLMAIAFLSDDISLCSNCKQGVAVLAPNNSIYVAKYQKFTQEVSQLDISTEYLDFVKKNQTNYYFIPLLKTEDLAVSVSSLSGKTKTVKVQMSDSSKPHENWAWNSETFGLFEEDDTIISSKEIAEDFKLNRKFLIIAVSGNAEGFYKIHVRRYLTDLIPLSFGITELGDLKKPENITFELEVWKDYRYEEITVSMEVLEGNVNIYGKNCGETRCKIITPENIANGSELEFKGSTHGNEYITFTPVFKADNAFYAFTLVPSTNTTKYKLSAKKANHYFPLKENSPVEYKGRKEDYQYFTYTYNPTGESKGKFKIVIDADFVVQGSTNQTCFIDLMNCGAFIKSGTLNNPLIYTPEEISPGNQIFVRVKPTRFLSFKIYVKFIDENSSIFLNDGKVVMGAFENLQQKQYFRFAINKSSSQNSKLFSVELNADLSSIKMYLGGKTCPDESNYISATTEGIIDFSSESGKVEDGNYCVLLRPTDMSKFPISFKIHYSSHSSPVMIEPNEIYNYEIEPQSKKFYSFYLDPKEDFVRFSLSVISPENSISQLFMTVSNHFVFDEKNENSISKVIPLNDTTQGIMSKKDLKDFCKDQEMFTQHCKLFIQIESTHEKSKIKFSLLVKSEMHLIEIKEGKEYMIGFNTFARDLSIFFRVRSYLNPIDISMSSYKTKISGFLYVVDDRSKTFQTHQLAKYETTLLKNFQPATNHFVTLDKKAFESCSPDCLVLMSLDYDSSENNSNTIDRLSIMVSSFLIPVQLGRHAVFQLEPSIMKYLTIDIGKDMFEKNKLLLFSITTDSERPKIYVDFNLGSSITKFPTQSSYQRFYFSPNLEMREENFPSEVVEQIKAKKSVMMVMGLYSDRGGKYSVSIDAYSFPIIQTFHGSQNSYYIPVANGSVFYRFNVGSDPELKFYLYKDYGDVEVHFYMCNEHNFNFSCINSSNAMHTISGKSSSLVYKLGKAQKITANDALLIQIECKAVARGTFVISEADEFANIMKNHLIWDEAEYDVPTYYKVDVDRDKPINFDIYASQGVVFYLSGYYEKNLSEYKMNITISAKESKHLLINAKDSQREDLFNWLPFQMKFQTLYIAVKATKPDSKAIFSFNLREEANSKMIASSTVNFETIPANSVRNFFFSHFDLKYEPKISIASNGIFDLTTLNVRLYFKQMTRDDEFIETFTEMVGAISTNTTNQLIFHLKNFTGTYKVAIENTKNFSMNISIMIQKEGYHYLPLGHAISDTLLPGEKFRMYEILIPKSGILVTDLMECSGNVGLVLTSNATQAENQNFSNYVEIESNKETFEITDVSAGGFFIGTTPLANTSSIFRIEEEFYENRDQIPHRAITFDDKIFYFYDGNKINLRFSAIQCPVCTEEELQISRVFYKVIVTSVPKILENVKCSVWNASQSNDSGISYSLKASQMNKELMMQVNGYEDSDAYVTVEAYINMTLKNRTSSLKKYYSVVEVARSNGGSKVLVLAIVVLSLAFIVALIATLIVLKKYRMVKDRLNYELEDIRNVAQVTVINKDMEDNGRSVEMSAKKNNYQNLVEEEKQ